VNIPEMLLTLQGHIADEFKAVHLNINTISQRVESTTQPTEDGEDKQGLINATSHEQSLANKTEHEQSLATPFQPTTRQNLIHQATSQWHKESQQQPANDNGAQSCMESCSWDDNRDPFDYKKIIYWSPVESNSDTGESTKTSDSTTRVIKDAFSKTLLAKKQKNVKKKSDFVHTKCPKLDPAIKSKLPKKAKDTDENLVRLQSKVLDVASPLVSLLESARRGTLTPKDAAETAQQALKLLGNASATISADRRQKATRYLNRELATLVKEPDTFSDAAPLLFGKEFDKQAREHMDTLRSLQRSSSFSGGRSNQSFWRGCPPMSRGGGNNRGNKQFKKSANKN